MIATSGPATGTLPISDTHTQAMRFALRQLAAFDLCVFLVLYSVLSNRGSIDAHLTGVFSHLLSRVARLLQSLILFLRHDSRHTCSELRHVFPGESRGAVCKSDHISGPCSDVLGLRSR